MKHEEIFESNKLKKGGKKLSNEEKSNMHSFKSKTNQKENIDSAPLAYLSNNSKNDELKGECIRKKLDNFNLITKPFVKVKAEEINYVEKINFQEKENTNPNKEIIKKILDRHKRKNKINLKRNDKNEIKNN